MQLSLILLLKLLLDSPKLLQLCRTLSLLTGKTWWFMLLLIISCFVRILIMLSFSKTCRSGFKTLLFRNLRHISFFWTIFHYFDIQVRSNESIFNSKKSFLIDLSRGFWCRILNCSFVNQLRPLRFQIFKPLIQWVMLLLQGLWCYFSQKPYTSPFH